EQSEHRGRHPPALRGLHRPLRSALPLPRTRRPRNDAHRADRLPRRQLERGVPERCAGYVHEAVDGAAAVPGGGYERAFALGLLGPIGPIGRIRPIGPTKSYSSYLVLLLF